MKQTRYIKEIQQRRWVYRSLMLIIFMLTAILFGYFIYPLPKNSEIQKWLVDLENYENITSDQLRSKKKFNSVKNNIAEMDVNVMQVQRDEEIKEIIRRFKNKVINKDGDFHSGYNKTAAGILQIYFDTRQELGVDVRTYENILKELEAVRSNMPEGGLSKSKYE